MFQSAKWQNSLAANKNLNTHLRNYSYQPKNVPQCIYHNLEERFKTSAHQIELNYVIHHRNWKFENWGVLDLSYNKFNFGIINGSFNWLSLSTLNNVSGWMLSGFQLTSKLCVAVRGLWHLWASHWHPILFR